GVLRPGYIQIRVTDIDAALRHYVDRVGLHEVSREPDGRTYLRAWDEFDRHSIVLRPAETPGTICRCSNRSKERSWPETAGIWRMSAKPWRRCRRQRFWPLAICTTSPFGT